MEYEIKKRHFENRYTAHALHESDGERERGKERDRTCQIKVEGGREGGRERERDGHVK